jgi:hypothetical protein
VALCWSRYSHLAPGSEVASVSSPWKHLPQWNPGCCPLALPASARRAQAGVTSRPAAGDSEGIWQRGRERARSRPGCGAALTAFPTGWSGDHSGAVVWDGPFPTSHSGRRPSVPAVGSELGRWVWTGVRQWFRGRGAGPSGPGVGALLLSAAGWGVWSRLAAALPARGPQSLSCWLVWESFSATGCRSIVAPGGYSSVCVGERHACFTCCVWYGGFCIAVHTLAAAAFCVRTCCCGVLCTNEKGIPFSSRNNTKTDDAAQHQLPPVVVKVGFSCKKSE